MTPTPEVSMPAEKLRISEVNGIGKIIHYEEPGKLSVPLQFDKYKERISSFEVRPDDVWLITYPKSGTTWTQEMLWLLCNNCDVEMARSLPTCERCPFLEFSGIKPVEAGNRDERDSLESIDSLPSPRLIKTHLPVPFLPKQLWTVKPKVIYVCRDPRDVAISFYHHQKLINDYSGELESYMDLFLADEVYYSPFWENVIGFWELRLEKNILFFSFEDMKTDLKKVVSKTANFLGKTITDGDMELLLIYLDIKTMRNNPSVDLNAYQAETKMEKADIRNNGLTYIREGESGGWRKTLSEEYVGKFENWVEENLNNSDFPLYR